MRVALAFCVLAACRGDKAPAQGSADPWNPPAVDPWNAPSDDAPSLLARAKHADAACPRVVAPYFFEIDKNGAKSYLLGTHHVSVPLAKMPEIVRARLGEAKLVVEETPGLEGHKKKRPDLDLAKELGEADWKHYGELVGPQIANAVAHGRPSAAVIMMSLLWEDPNATLDREIAQLTHERAVPLRGLESDDFQDDLIDELMSVRLLRADIEHTKDRHELDVESAADLRQYCEGKIHDPGLGDAEEAKLRAGGYSQAEIDAITDQLLNQRNTRWIPELEEIFTTGGAFVAVGSDHLLGPKGVVEQLRARGWTITRVAPN